MTKILLVEDDKSLREIYGVRLLAEGYDIVSAGDGEEALAMAIKDRPQLIVSDVMMPKISGFDMLDILRSTTETKDIKVIMMTALSSEDQRARGEQLGADRYLVKSQVGIEDVVRTVHEVLGDAPVTSATTTPLGTSSIAAPRPAAPAAVPPRPAAQPVAAPAPAPQTAPAPSTGLPQPTAPFSTSRPASLGERVIHPIPNSAPEGPDVASLMDQELSGVTSPTVGNAFSEPAAQPVAAPAPAPQTAPAAPVAPPAPPTPVTPPAGAPSLAAAPAPPQTPVDGQPHGATPFVDPPKAA